MNHMVEINLFIIFQVENFNHFLVIPTSVQWPSTWQVNGPPESPWHASRPPVRRPAQRFRSSGSAPDPSSSLQCSLVRIWKSVYVGYKDIGWQFTGMEACWRASALLVVWVLPHPVIKQTGLFVWSDLTTLRSALNSGGGRQIFWT